MHNYSLAHAARLLGTGKNTLIAELKKRRILDYQRLPVQQHIAAGRFVTDLRQHTGNARWNNGNGQLYSVTLITPKGLWWLAEQLGVSIRDMDQPEPESVALKQAREAIRLLQMHINCPTAVSSETALAVADEAMALLAKQGQRGTA